MRASLLTRAGTVAAAAVIATTGAMAVAGAADASVHHRIPTHVSASKDPVAGSSDTTLDARLTTGFRHLRNIPLGGRVVFLDTIRFKHGKIVLHQVARDRKSTRLNSSHITRSRMPSSA